jgi:hypothetical protein
MHILRIIKAPITSPSYTLHGSENQQTLMLLFGRRILDLAVNGD